MTTTPLLDAGWGVALVAVQWGTLARFVAALVAQRRTAVVYGLLHYGGTFGGAAWMLHHTAALQEQVVLAIGGGYLMGTVVAVAWIARRHQRMQQQGVQ